MDVAHLERGGGVLGSPGELAGGHQEPGAFPARVPQTAGIFVGGLHPYLVAPPGPRLLEVVSGQNCGHRAVGKH